ncbi:hypothetical protein BCR33DRAFT_779527 [Rhizoclosmatium globosum]|uniref:Uncharacterized protein n=1 Tax=Rhizoclosmatium globosum TaxID=329046 RepID=A0A1Y2D1Q1_9FUNG|nr:hypothetical protein BCR33DRAFT_779527 [Rhizoclosmatium globosum]|eukprot:ORY53209.1 hypothetical protein BCR33DRAFT_779527 [Rhizoclosmatium globosum]
MRESLVAHITTILAAILADGVYGPASDVHAVINQYLPSFSVIKGKTSLNLTSPLAKLLRNPSSETKFDIVAQLAEKWTPIELVDTVKAEGVCLVISLNSIKLIETVICQKWKSSEQAERSVVIQFDLPFGNSFDPSHFRGALIAQYVKNSLYFLVAK